MSDTEQQAGHGTHNRFNIVIDTAHYTVTETSMTGAQLKALAGKDAQYQLFLEEHGDQPDRLIGDSEAVAIREGMHFYAVPPATFGRFGI